MSSQNQAPSESTHLLNDNGLATSRSRSRERSLSRGWLRLSPQTRLIPVVLGTELACQLPTTTFVELVRQTVCRVVHGSTNIPVTFLEGGPPVDHCGAPDVVRYFALVMAVLGVIEGFSWVAGYGFLSHFSSQSGRKPALLLLLATGIAGCCLIVSLQFTPNWLGGWLLLLGVLLRMLCGSPLFSYLSSLYTTDICTPENRTAALSKIGGWTALGLSISLFLGGFVTTNTGNPLIVFYMAATIFAAVFMYSLLFLPESFPAEKRDALAQLQREHTANLLPTITCFPSFIPILMPLKILAPTRKLDGTYNWRLMWCALHNFIFTAVNTYAPTAWMVLVTSKYNLSPADTGLFFSIVTMSSTIVLIAIVPSLVRLLRPYYERKPMRSPPDEEHPSDGDVLNSGTSDHLNVHLTFVACVITAIFYLTAAASTTIAGLISSGVCIGFAFMRSPGVRSLVAGSIDPLKQGEALASFEMVSSVGSVLSPIIMGSILTATIDSTPLLLFYVHLAVVLLSGALLFFIRDADRYQKPHEASCRSD